MLVEYQRILRRDNGSQSTVAYGFLTFEDDFSYRKALIAGHRSTAGAVKAQVGRAESATIFLMAAISRLV